MRIATFLKNMFAGEQVKPEIKEDPIIDEALRETSNRKYWYNLKANDINVYQEKIVPLSDRDKAAFIITRLNDIAEWNKDGTLRNYNDEISKKIAIIKAFIEQLFRSKLDLNEGEISQLTTAFLEVKARIHEHIMDWPLKNLVGIIQKKYKTGNLPDSVEQDLKKIRLQLAGTKHVTYEKPAIKLVEQIDVLLFKDEEQTEERPVYFLGQDDFALFANQLLANLPVEEKAYWNKLMALCQKSGGSTLPAQKFTKDGNAVIEDLNRDKFIKMMADWFDFIIRLKEKLYREQYYTKVDFITSVNVECLKGFVWLCSSYATTELLQTIALVADRAYRKIPGIGQTCTMLGNASVYSLYKSPGLVGVGHLSRLKLRVKQANTQSLIEKYLAATAVERKISVDAIEDLAVDDFGLVGGKKDLELEGFKAKISVEKIGKVKLAWYKKDGSTQLSDPAIVKENQPEALKQLKATCKAIEASLSTQRDRFDQRFRSTAKVSWDYFKTNYFDHGLVSFISQKLIWRFEKPNEVFDAIHWDGHWQDHSGNLYNPDADYEVSLWHPALDSLDNVRLWRFFLIEKELQQPLKQAYREIYLLTDAEVNTRTYSNRMASHILKQHQFNSLVKGRGWRYSLQGAFDGGSDGTAKLNLTEHTLIAEYWTTVAYDEANITDSGILKYIATDQVRFRNSKTNTILDLADVPAVVFSEVMRDTDLFVGVASVGNDPTWSDNGDWPGHQAYWHSYSFGDLSEVAKNRKEILARLIPRLKIARVAELKDKFLIVRGKKRTYKIHLGSTNILMEPNDQYLCIVPERKVKEVEGKVFLPFEGDSGLSIIISKALLLADDDKITDETITRQINR